MSISTKKMTKSDYKSNRKDKSYLFGVSVNHGAEALEARKCKENERKYKNHFKNVRPTLLAFVVKMTAVAEVSN